MQANSKKDLFQLSGDDPNQQKSMSGTNLNDSALCKPVVYYKSTKNNMERFLTLDIHALPGAPMYAVIYCPLCQSRDPENKRNMSLTIKADNKAMDLDPKAFPRIPGFTTPDLVRQLGLQHKDEIRGRISIEPFKCTWEENPDENRGATGVVGGLISACCDWAVAIDNNIARDV